jgi:hypothetical protein
MDSFNTIEVNQVIFYYCEITFRSFLLIIIFDIVKNAALIVKLATRLIIVLMRCFFLFNTKRLMLMSLKPLTPDCFGTSSLGKGKE